MVVTRRMTPDDLRRIADDGEKKWASSKAGDSIVVARWYGRGFEVEFAYDQERMHAEEKKLA